MNCLYSVILNHRGLSCKRASVQKHGRFPCGTDRNLIWKFGKPDTSVILMQYIRENNDWIFPKLEKFTIEELYPHQYEVPDDLWDN